MYDFKDRLITRSRTDSNGMDTSDSGSSPVLLHTRGARNDGERVDLALSLRDGDDWFVTTSAAGTTGDPTWVANIRTHPEIEIDAQVNGEIHTIEVRAAELTDEEHETVLSGFMNRFPSAVSHRRHTERSNGRLQPIVRLTPRQAEVRPVDDPAPARVAPDDATRDISIRRPNTDESLPHYGVVGDNYTMVLGKDDTASRYALIDMHVPSGGGPPPHRHDFEEMFYVLEGQIDITFRGETTAIHAGEVVNIPARAPHNFHNSTDSDARMLCMVSPLGLDEYFRQWGKPLPTRTALSDLSDKEAEQSLAMAIELGPSYAIENLPPD